MKVNVDWAEPENLNNPDMEYIQIMANSLIEQIGHPNHYHLCNGYILMEYCKQVNNIIYFFTINLYDEDGINCLITKDIYEPSKEVKSNTFKVPLISVRLIYNLWDKYKI